MILAASRKNAPLDFLMRHRKIRGRFIGKPRATACGFYTNQNCAAAPIFLNAGALFACLNLSGRKL